MNYERWLQLMKKIGLDENKESYDALIAAYCETHRYYHNHTHIDAVLAILDNFSTLAQNKSEIELALWFHDAIYKPFSSTNEVDSANWACKFLHQNCAPSETQKTVHNLIMATSYAHLPRSNDEMLITNIDLAILGSAEVHYSRFKTNVRREYIKVPDCIYRTKRKAVLKGFLNRDRIYSMNQFYDEFEAQARVNLQKEINQLVR